jgi:translation initiation factor 2B subunit (eIF-2B alpha/beta/delta family)
MGKLHLTENQFKTYLKHAILEQNNDEYHKMSPEEYTELLKYSGYHGRGISKLPMFKGKPIWITGGLDISNTPTDSLGNVRYIDGGLTITNTNISDISNIQVKGHVWDGGTPRQRKRNAEILRQKMEEASERQSIGEWDLNNPEIDDLGLAANALFNNLVNNGKITDIDEDEINELKEKMSELEILQKQYDESEDHDNELYDKISDLEDEIESLKSKSVSVYNLIPMNYNYYGLYVFEIIGIFNLISEEYAVGHDDIMDKAVYKYAKDYIDDIGLEGFNESFLEDHIDEDEVAKVAEEFWYMDVRDNPEAYFDKSDFQLTDEQEERIKTLEDYISTLENLLVDTNFELNDCEENCEEIEDKISEIEDNINEAQEELDGIEPDTEPTEDMIDSFVEDRVYDAKRDPLQFLKDFGMDWMEYVDKDSLAESLVSSDGYGIMSSYDGSYDTEEVNGQIYYILRIN